MYFIRLHPMKELLRDRVLTDRESLPYYVLFMACTTAFLALPMQRETNHWDVLSSTINVVLTIGGVLYCFIQNGGKSGYDFILKSVVLGWVVTIRLVPMLIAMCVLDFFIKKCLAQSMGVTTWVNAAIAAAFLAIYYQRLGRHIKDTNGNLANPTSEGIHQPADGSPKPSM